MTKKTAGTRPLPMPLAGPVHSIADHSAALVDVLGERAQSAVQGQFGVPPFNSFEEAVLAYGRPFTEAVIPTGRRLGRMKHCYRNALAAAFRSIATECPLTYCEGFATPVQLGI